MDEAGERAPIPNYGLRVAGFLITVAGVLLAGVGTIRAWIQVSIEGADTEVLTTRLLGTDLWQGKVVLALAAVALVAVLVTRMGATAMIRKAAAAVLVVVSFAVIAVAGSVALAGTSAYVDDEVAVAATTGLSPAAQDALRASLEATIQPGVWLTLAGGGVMVVGSTLTLAWAMRPRPDWDDAESAEHPAASDA